MKSDQTSCGCGVTSTYQAPFILSKESVWVCVNFDNMASIVRAVWGGFGSTLFPVLDPRGHNPQHMEAHQKLHEPLLEGEYETSQQPNLQGVSSSQSIQSVHSNYDVSKVYSGALDEHGHMVLPFFIGQVPIMRLTAVLVLTADQTPFASHPRRRGHWDHQFFSSDGVHLALHRGGGLHGDGRR